MFQDNAPKFFGRRKGRTIHKAKQTLTDKFLPKIKISINDAHNLAKCFDFKPKRMMLEIGFGNGQHLAGQAKAHPWDVFLGVEVFQNGIANLLSLLTGIKEGNNLPEDFVLETGRTDNVRVFDDDVRLLFEHIPDETFDKIFVLFPDPWPKKKHAPRRFVNQQNLDSLSRILKKGGILRIATDHPVYKPWTLQQMKQRGDFVWTAKCSNDWRLPPCDHIETKYQLKAIAEGRRPVFFDYMKI